jgi:hypothetical protein
LFPFVPGLNELEQSRRRSMKTRLVMVSAAIALCLIEALGASSKPNFSGNWVMDKDRSFSNPPGLDQTILVVQTGDEIKIESKLITPQGERMVNEAYSLDGKEFEFEPPGQAGAKGKRTAHWLPDHRGFVVEDTVTTTSANGPVVGHTTRKWTLSPDGSRLTIDYYIDSQRGSYEAKRVFAKK